MSLNTCPQVALCVSETLLIIARDEEKIIQDGRNRMVGVRSRIALGPKFLHFSIALEFDKHEKFYHSSRRITDGVLW